MRFRGIWAAPAAALLALAACGDDDDGDAGTGTDTEAEAGAGTDTDVEDTGAGAVPGASVSFDGDDHEVGLLDCVFADGADRVFALTGDPEEWLDISIYGSSGEDAAGAPSRVTVSHGLGDDVSERWEWNQRDGDEGVDLEVTSDGASGTVQLSGTVPEGEDEGRAPGDAVLEVDLPCP